MSDFFRLMQNITDAYRERHGLPCTPTGTDAEREAAHEALDNAEELLFPADPLELAALKREYAREDAESRHACDLPGSGE